MLVITRREDMPRSQVEKVFGVWYLVFCTYLLVITRGEEMSRSQVERVFGEDAPEKFQLCLLDVDPPSSPGVPIVPYE